MKEIKNYQDVCKKNIKRIKGVYIFALQICHRKRIKKVFEKESAKKILSTGENLFYVTTQAAREVLCGLAL